jgi:MFS family permease
VPVAGLAPLRHRPFALFWVGAATSDVGTWVQLAAIGSLVAATSGSALATGLVAAATFAPQGICSPLGGVIADRLDRRRVFLATLAVQTVVTATIAVVVASGVRSAATLSALVLVQSASGALGGPSMQAILPDLVPRSELTAAVALGLTGWNSGRVVGPLLAAALVPFGTHWAIAANAISFAALWCAIALFRRPFPPAAGRRSSIGVELADGVRALLATRGCIVALVTALMMHLVFIPFMGLLPAAAKDLIERRDATGVIDDDRVASTAAWLMSAQGIGAIIGSVAVASIIAMFDRSTIVAAALAVIAVLVPLHAFAPTTATTALVVAVLGGVIAMCQSTMGGVVQRDAPPEHRGRILSWYFGIIGLSYGVGLTIVGAISDRFGPRTTFAVAGVIVGVFALVAVRTPAWRTGLDGTIPDGSGFATDELHDRGHAGMKRTLDDAALELEEMDRRETHHLGADRIGRQHEAGI